MKVKTKRSWVQTLKEYLLNAGWWSDPEAGYKQVRVDYTKIHEPSRRVFVFLILTVVVLGVVAFLSNTRGCERMAYDAFDAGLDSDNRGRGLKEGREGF